MIIGEIFGLFGTLGASSLVAKAAGSFIPENAGTIAKVGYFFGIAGLSGAAGEAAGKKVKKQVNDIGKVINLIKAANTPEGKDEFVDFMEDKKEEK